MKEDIDGTCPAEVLVSQVEEHVKDGCVDRSTSLGIQRMPSGYALMLNADHTHYYWLRYDGSQSVIHWSRWVVYRWAKHDAKHQP